MSRRGLPPRSALGAALLSLAILGCSGENTPTTPSAACDAIAVAVCEKAYSCQPSLQGSPSDCATAAETQDDCAAASCPGGTTFSSSNAGACLDGINSGGCSFSLPQSCSALCE